MNEKAMFYLKLFGDNIKIYDGYICLYGRAYEKRERILANLQRLDPTIKYKPDFFAGLNRIEFYKIGGR